MKDEIRKEFENETGIYAVGGVDIFRTHYISWLEEKLTFMTEDRDLWHETERACSNQYNILLDENTTLTGQVKELREALIGVFNTGLVFDSMTMNLQTINEVIMQIGLEGMPAQIINAKEALKNTGSPHSVVSTLSVEP